MNEYRDDDRKWCYFHPKELVVGVCALCLNERLLVLAASSKQSLLRQTNRVTPHIFALTTLLNPFHIKHHKSHTSSTIQEQDSFISIKFEDNGVASWDKGEICKMPQCESNEEATTKKIKSVVEHAKPRGGLRWRRRIGQLFQLIRWKRSSKGNTCHVGTKVEGAKVVKYGWMRTLTKRRTRE